MGNILVPRQGFSAPELFYVIDFGMARPSGNALYDLAYLEMNILLELLSPTPAQEDLVQWWRLQQRLSAGLAGDTQVKGGGGLELLGWDLVSPIRQAISEQIQADGEKTPITFLAASMAAAFRPGKRELIARASAPLS